MLKKEYPFCCETCENRGMYTCKMIVIDKTCMFYKEEQSDNESEQETYIE